MLPAERSKKRNCSITLYLKEVQGALPADNRRVSVLLRHGSKYSLRRDPLPGPNTGLHHVVQESHVRANAGRLTD